MSPSNSERNLLLLCEELRELNDRTLNSGVTVDELHRVLTKFEFSTKKRNKINAKKKGYVSRWITAVLIVVAGVLIVGLERETVIKTLLGTRCMIPNNFLIWEATRPIADCNICKGMTNAIVLHNVTREEFETYAYSYKPILVKKAALHWPAMHKFSYKFFKELFENTEGSYESVEEECQLLTFKTEFVSLKEVFSMSKARVLNEKGEQPWYIGWSNCHPGILAAMRAYYPRPHFLPKDAEHAQHDFIFMGFAQGAAMHLDYISRLMWQAQLRGHKMWLLQPPPECEHVCGPLSFRAEPGDIVLLDTRQWYHKTVIDEDEFSLTVSSEYG